jgi:hypothetical protein
MNIIDMGLAEIQVPLAGAGEFRVEIAEFESG